MKTIKSLLNTLGLFGLILIAIGFAQFGWLAILLLLCALMFDVIFKVICIIGKLLGKAKL